MDGSTCPAQIAVEILSGYTSLTPPSHEFREAQTTRWRERLCKDDMEGFYETLAVASFRHSPFSVTIARAEDHDHPLVGCSAGFELLNGYSEAEIIGKNCRFLNAGCHVKADQRHGLRVAVSTGRPFIGRLQNRRKNGEIFSVLLDLRNIRIGSSMYILGIQHEISDKEPTPDSSQYDADVQQVVEDMFSTIAGAEETLELEIGTEASNEFIRQLSTMSHASVESESKARQVVSLETAKYSCKNTFLDVQDWRDNSLSDGPMLRPSLSESCLPTYQSDCTKVGEVSAEQPENNIQPDVGYRSTPELEGRPTLYEQQTHVDTMERLPVYEWSARQGSTFKEASAPPGQFPAQQFTHQVDSVPMQDSSLASSSQQMELQVQPEVGSPVARTYMMSVGSVGHPDSCTPCAFYCFSLCGCNRGSQCEYCHMDHPKRLHRRRTHKVSKGGPQRTEEQAESPAKPKNQNRSARSGGYNRRGR